MYKRDLITAEIEKLAQVLAKIMGLKLAGNFDDAEEMFKETMGNSFGLNIQILYEQDVNSFKLWLETANLSAEKLDSLSEFLYYELGVSPIKNQLIAPKLNLVYDYLANQHKTVHLVNLHRQQTIQQYL